MFVSIFWLLIALNFVIFYLSNRYVYFLLIVKHSSVTYSGNIC